MAKLSRTARFQDLRDKLDEETTAAQTTHSDHITLTRSSRASNPAHHANDARTSETAVEDNHSSTVMDELLGEVKQYNIDNGDRVIEDTQFNILKTLDSNPSRNSRRNAHMEVMEANEEAGGTTMNVLSQNPDVLSRPISPTNGLQQSPAAAKTEPVELPEAAEPAQQTEAPVKRDIDIAPIHFADRLEEEEIVLSEPEEETRVIETVSEAAGIRADDADTRDDLQLFDLGADDFDKTIRQQAQPEKYNSRKEMKKARKIEKAREQNSMQEAEILTDSLSSPTERIDYEPAAEPKKVKAVKEKEPSSGRTGNIVLTIMIILLVIAIAATLYLIWKARLL